ncbi:ABC transporter ATP-binding protein [Neokomagataea thailandica NBRC 106555]|uniref:ABC transporter ATP-binding protein n=2 Tax=Neokomagataea TaxID=1223423 RepID=A0A4Y6V919_9PROT|nr:MULTISPECIES: ABC transporter ATP-binding protein [Neokomagataea]QDH25006.1 ABC transporter ATP-binding protein [Neokomagataea tanensis]GBR51517.1 ABC transporter ATP-binding protein [Neokomagataea thailandica NBRC 106555]
MSPENIIDVSELTKKFGTFTALENISFSTKPGETIGLLGRNGAGKSTLIGCLLGFLLPSTGEIKVFGQDIATLPREKRACTGYVPQTMSGFDHFKVGKLIDFISAFYGPLPPVSPQLLAWADLDPKKIVKTLSGGQKQRLAILLAMRHNPKFLLLDEPVASLDPQARRSFMSLLEEFAQVSGANIIISSHILSDIERVCSRLLFLKNGKLILDCSTQTFQQTTRWLHNTSIEEISLLPLKVLAKKDRDFLVFGWNTDLNLSPETRVSIPDFEDAFLDITEPEETQA